MSSLDLNLNGLFHPKSIAVIGANDRPGSVGLKVVTNLIDNHFAGELFLINPKHTELSGRPCYASVSAVRGSIDLAVIVTPASTVPEIMKECGEKGIGHAIIISAGFSEIGKSGKLLEQNLLEIAKRYHLRFIGPNCLGVMRPAVKLNATFDNNNALPGKIALLSQSGAICAAILDWAISKGIGFSTIVSMGNSVDLDFGDLLEYLANDPLTDSILLYIEGVHHPSRFIEGLRAAANKKPVIAIKGGRHNEGVRAVHSHTGALVGNDDVFTAALNRGGAVRVMTIEQLFTAAEMLSGTVRVQGKRLTIITNGGGAGVMAADRATDLNIDLPQPDEKKKAVLNKILPAEWSHQNPIDIIGDATPERYRKVMEACLEDTDSDALLIILVPIAMSKPYEVAQEVCQFAKKSKKPVIACWMGEEQSKTSWQLFSENNIPCYSTPEVAVEAFSYLMRNYENQQLMRQVPEPLISSKKWEDNGVAKEIIDRALASQRKMLTPFESKAVLEAFDIPIAKTIEARNLEEALNAAESIGFPVAMKINSSDISHKQDVGGVKLNIEDAKTLQVSYEQMITTVKRLKPNASISGVTIERMYHDSNYRELMIGIVRDNVFGPVISFGLGGSLVEIVQDNTVALPPLNDFLAHQMIAKTKASKMLGEFRGKPAIDMNALIDVLLKTSLLISKLPEIKEMDINPLLVNEKEAVAIDVRFMLS